MKTLKQILNSGRKIAGTALLASMLAFPLFAGNAKAQESETRQAEVKEEYGKAGDIHFRNKEYGINKSPIEVGLTLDCLWSFNYEVDVPGKFVPKSPVEGYIGHEVLGGAGLRLGPKISLFSTLEAGIKYNVANISGGADNNYETYWGGYGIGQYACIGSVETHPSPFSYDLTIQTPHLHLGGDITVRAFCSRINEDFELHYKSGYHKYTRAFYEVEDHFKIGDFKSEGTRYGLKFSLFKEVEDLVVTFFYQNNELEGSLTEKGKEFKCDKEQRVMGWTLEGTF